MGQITGCWIASQVEGDRLRVLRNLEMHAAALSVRNFPLRCPLIRIAPNVLNSEPPYCISSTFGVNIKILTIIRSAVPILEQVIKKETAMEMTKILSDLRQEREQLEEAILTLERLGLSRGKRGGARRHG